MSFYNEEVARLSKKIYPDETLTRHIIRARQFMDQHFAEAIDVEQVASKAMISKFHSIRLFKNYYGVTPHQYLISVRIAQAKKLLRNGESISGACFAAGFSSVTHFTGLYKKMTGKTPAVSKKQKSNF